MILIGHPYIDFEPLERVDSSADVAQTSSNATVVFNFEEEKVALCHYAVQNGVGFALFVKNTREVILASALSATYIICDKALAKTAQAFADDYLFDAKILLQADDEADIEYAAKHRLDGILFDKGIKDGSR